MSEIKKCITSRFGISGVVIEADFKQLEVFALAFQSGDFQLRKDLEDGLDMHCLNCSHLFDKTYEFVFEHYMNNDPEWSKKRKISKPPGFLIQYGGGADEMAAQTGLPVEMCKKFIQRYYERYTGVKAWQDENIKKVQASRTLSDRYTVGRYPAGRGVLNSLTGRIYVFYEEDSPPFLRKRGIMTSFRPTQIKNYPVQGFATGDIVPEVGGRMWREFIKNPTIYVWCKMINTVHDSLLFDCHLDYLDLSLPVIKTTCEKAPIFLKERFDIDFDLELKVDIEVGESWGEKVKIDI